MRKNRVVLIVSLVVIGMAAIISLVLLLLSDKVGGISPMQRCLNEAEYWHYYDYPDEKIIATFISEETLRPASEEWDEECECKAYVFEFYTETGLYKYLVTLMYRSRPLISGVREQDIIDIDTGLVYATPYYTLFFREVREC